MNYYTVMVAFYLIGVLVITTYFFRRTEGRSLLLSLAAVGWTLDPKTELGILWYGAQVIGGGAMTAVILSGRLQAQKNQPPVKLDTIGRKIFLGLLAAVAVQIFTALYLGQGFEGVARFGLLALLFLHFYTIGSGPLKALATQSLWLGSAGVVSIIFSSFLQGAATSVTELGVLRFGGLIGHPNYAGYFAAAICILWFVNRELPWGKFNFFLCLFSTLLTQGRTAILALAFGLLIAALGQKRRRIEIWSIGLFMALAVITTDLGQQLFNRFSFIGSSGGVAGQNSSGWRLLQWETALDKILQSNWKPVGWNQSGQYLLSGLPPHNFLLQVSLEFGVAGFVVFGLIAFLMFRLLFRTKNLRPLIPVFILGSVFDAGMLVPSFAFVYFAVSILWARQSTYFIGSTLNTALHSSDETEPASSAIEGAATFRSRIS